MSRETGPRIDARTLPCSSDCRLTERNPARWTGHNTLRKYHYIMTDWLTDWLIVPYVGDSWHRKQPQLMSYVNVRFWPCSDMLMCVSFSWTLRMSEIWVWWHSGTLLKEYDLALSSSGTAEAEIFYADGQTGRTKVVVAFRNFANAPKMALD